MQTRSTDKTKKIITDSKTENFCFLDICAGIGGFHQAMSKLGGKCVGAFEIDPHCIETYSKNFPDTPILGDLTKYCEETALDNFQVLCAGFPCQPFSKAGKRLGFQDESRGKLFFKIMDILDKHPEVDYLLLENVRNLADQKEYWDTICADLHKRNFTITDTPLILSPSDFSIPQIRERVFILGIRKTALDKRKLRHDTITKESLHLHLSSCADDQAFRVLEKSVDSQYYVSDTQQEILLAWDEFRENTGIKVIGFPIWLCAMGIGIDNSSTYLKETSFGDLPKWKQTYYRKNRNLYLENRKFIDDWTRRYNMSNQTKLYQKFEWNCGVDVPDMKHGIIQIRQSGIRVKRPNYFPALVAMNNTPIVWEEKSSRFRKITPKEAAKLQSFSDDFQFYGQENQQYKQLGNAVNVEIAYQLGKSLFRLRKGCYSD